MEKHSSSLTASQAPFVNTGHTRVSTVKKFVIEKNPPKKISQIEFGILSPQDAVRLSHVQIVNRELYQVPSRTPTAFGCLDLRLGTTDKSSTCSTCGLKIADCAGHFGFIRLTLPVFHIGYFKAVLVVLQVICKSCSHVMVKEDEKKKFLARLRSPRTEGLQRKGILKQITDKGRRAVRCPHCNQLNGPVRKTGSLKIVHELSRVRKGESIDEYYREFADAVEANKDLGDLLGKANEDLNPLKVHQLFSRIPDDEVELLDMDSVNGRPEKLILTHVLVPPVCIRPSIQIDVTGGSNEDDLTMKLTEIVHLDQIIKNSLEKGVPMSNILENWEYLQIVSAIYINSDLPGFPSHIQAAHKPARSLCQRLKGKQGRFRGNLSGKRVDFSSRTVISPDPNIDVDEVQVPKKIAMALTYPEVVSLHNIAKLQELVRAGPDNHPGANFVQYSEGKRYLRYGDRNKIADGLKMGDKVERHLSNGDIVLFNRQPSLHKLSIMSHRVRVSPHRTFQINECVCPPYNADFDGDEMNLHVPQTEEARAEALTLMSVKKNLVTPRNGELIIAAIQDIITAGFLLTKRDRFFDRAEFSLICSYFGDASERIELPVPAVLKPLELWTGKQVFSVLLRPTSSVKQKVTFEAAGRNYSENEHMCKNDGYICFRNSEHISGRLDKKSLGSGSKTSLFYVVLKDIGSDEAARCMSRVARLCTRWLSNEGFSIGIDDVAASETLVSRKHVLVAKGYDKCNEYIEEFKKGTLSPQPGCNLDETLEAIMTGELSRIREDAGRLCLQELRSNNAPLIMSLCGSKGSTLNISQMVACVGQQTVGGQRVPNGFLGRSLPHFKVGAKEPAARGFVKNSFYGGLNPSEFFFHTMAGREGLVDTAVKTAETGYMQRRLMKALEDLTCHYDGTIRNSTGGIVQFEFGDDGLDPSCMDVDGNPVDFNRLSMNVIAGTITDNDLMSIGDTTLPVDSEWIDAELNEIIHSNNPKDGAGVSLSMTPRKFQEQFSDFCKQSKVISAMNRNQFSTFVKQVQRTYSAALTEPGSAVGAITAQSLGEPATQMTLKTFHFAGVASMNVTLGVPRIKEIINATKSISTPIISAELLNSHDVKSARIVKGRIEKTVLGEVCEYMKEVFDCTDCYLEIKLDADLIDRLQLEISAISVRRSILSGKAFSASVTDAKGPTSNVKLKLKSENVTIVDDYTLRVYPPGTAEGILSDLQSLRAALPNAIVAGLPSISRAVINNAGKQTYNLLVEGCDLRGVMAIPGVASDKASSNHVLEVFSVLGIEAARRKIIDEIRYTMNSHSINLDSRHVMLLADLMCNRGEVLGITRFGIGKMKDSVLMLASFEKTIDHLFDSAVRGRKDPINGVSECIILGIPVPLGTGLFGLVQKSAKVSLPAHKDPLLWSY